MQLNVQTTPPAEVQSTPIEPYVGPRSFLKEQRQFFFGRDEEITKLMELFGPQSDGARGRFVAVVGPSGSGKSSLVRAGLVAPPVVFSSSFKP